MKKYFSHYYRLTDSDFAELWEKCVFVLDTNILTNLYRYSDEARADFMKLLKKISTRLWIPHQVALEFQGNRLGVIAEQIEKFSELRHVLEETKKTLAEKLEKLKLTDRHPSIQPQEIIEKTDALFDNLLKDLAEKEKKQPGVLDDDKIRTEIDSLIDDKIGSPPESQSKLDEIYKAGKIRYEFRQPPGYMDIDKEKENSSKSKAHFNKGLIFRRKYGDLILWRELMDEAREKGHKYIIFVTDDNKEDWWLFQESQGKKTIGPRPELIDEISAEAGVKLFYMYNSERFLQYGKKFLNVQVKEESISEVGEIGQYASIADSYYNYLSMIRMYENVIKQVGDKIDLAINSPVLQNLANAISQIPPGFQTWYADFLRNSSMYNIGSVINHVEKKEDNDTEDK